MGVQYTTIAKEPTIVLPINRRVTVSVPDRDAGKVTSGIVRQRLDRASVILSDLADTERNLGFEIHGSMRSVRYLGGLDYYFASEEIAFLACRLINRYIDGVRAVVAE